MMRQIRQGCLVLAAMVLLSGCAAHWPETDSTLAAPSKTFQIAPKQLVTIVKEVVSSPPLSIGVVEEKDGSILTGPQRFTGDLHVVRKWQEQTRYRITIIPDWNDPTGVSRIEVRSFTEQRATDGQEWRPAPELQRPERARDLLNTIEAQIQARKK